MSIRPANTNDIPTIEAIFSNAKQYMRENGNKHQWSGTYPEREIIERDISGGNCYVYVLDNRIVGVFSLFDGPDPTYAKIYDGKWPNDDDYAVIHRIAITVHGKGIADECYDFGMKRKGVLRIDTHRDNIPMQKSLQKNGFTRCGIIYLASGDERIAFCKFTNNR